MRLERVIITVLSSPVAEPVPMSFSALAARTMVVVEVQADGLIGVGESWVNYPAWAASERLATLEQGVVPLLAGLDISDPALVQRHLLSKLEGIARQWGAPGPVWQAISAIDIALWDLRGLAASTSVASLLGTSRQPSSVGVYASGIGPSAIEELCAAATTAGITAVKARVGFGRERDEETLARIRAAMPTATDLLVDANQAWSVDEARAFCAWASGFNITWLEEPVAGNSLTDLAALHRAVDVPIACGENLYGHGEFTRYVRSGAVGMIQPDLTKSGGFTVAVPLLRDLPDGVTASPHCYGGGIVTAASVQLAAASPSVAWVELDVRPNPLRDALVRDRFRPCDGRVPVPRAPGLGVELDRDVMDQYLVDRRECELSAVV